MKTASLIRFDCLGYDMGCGLHDFTSGKLTLTLANKQPDPAKARTLADIVEIPATGSYPRGGLSLFHKWRAEPGGRACLSAAEIAIKADGGPIGPFRYAVIASTSAKGKPLIGYLDCGVVVDGKKASVTLEEGESYVLSFKDDLLYVELTP